MSFKGPDNDNWIDNVIMQHKKQLEEMKKNRTTIDKIDENSTNSRMIFSENDFHISKNDGVSTALEESQDNLFNNNLEKAGYMNIKDNYAVDTETNKNSNHIIKYNITYPKTSDRYQNYKDTPKNAIPTADEYQPGEESVTTQNLKSSLDVKNLRLRELKRQFDAICEENAKYKIQINELTEKLLICEEEKKNNKAKYIERERDLVATIKQIEQDKMKSDEHLSKISSMNNIKSQEIDLMNQKFKDFEVIMNENANDYLFQIKKLKSQIEEWKAKSYEYEKMSELMNYFLKKIWSLYTLDVGKNKSIGANRSDSNEDNIEASLKAHDSKLFQDNLIELENFIIKLVNEKNTLQLKYHKILERTTKLSKETLDQRVNEIEKELLFHREASAKSKESIAYSACENTRVKRSKSSNKKIIISSQVEMKNTKKKKTKLKSQVEQTPKKIKSIRSKSPLAVSNSNSSGKKHLEKVIQK